MTLQRDLKANAAPTPTPMSQTRKHRRSESPSSQRTRMRVDASQISSMLFGVFESTDLSPCDSDSLSDFGSDFESESDFAATGSAPTSFDFHQPSIAILSGDWTGVRKASHQYHLRADEDLSGPDVLGLDIKVVSLGRAEKEVITKFSKYLELNWPSQQLNADLACTRHLAFSDPTTFWHILYRPEFPKYLDYLTTVSLNENKRVGHLLIYSFELHTQGHSLST